MVDKRKRKGSSSAKSSNRVQPSASSRAQGHWPLSPRLQQRQAARLAKIEERRARGEALIKRRPTYKRTPTEKAQQMSAFLATLRETGNVRCSCEAAGIDRNVSYTWRQENETFKALWKEALENAIDLLEKEAWRRGYEGYDAPVVYQGKVTSTYKEYSDRMLEILLKAHRKKFREKYELTGEDGGPIVTRVERVIVKPKSGAK